MTLLGKNKSPSAVMAGEKGDAFKYNDIPEEDRQAFEAKLKQQEEEAKQQEETSSTQIYKQCEHSSQIYF